MSAPFRVAFHVPEHALLVIARHDGRALLGVELRARRSAAPCQPPARELERRLENDLGRYFAGEAVEFRLPLAKTQGTRFQRAVWDALRAIPCGETRTYGWVARSVGRPGAARAVGGACGSNPWPVIVPCHRVVASDGTLGGYSAGLKWKRLLLRVEGVLTGQMP
jgi:methylated-DNA-[protein]-cysteine S-methyltransferase